MGKEKKQYSVSSCFEDKRYDERVYIDEVIKHTKIRSFKIFPDMSKVFEELDTIIWHMDEPFGSTSIYAQCIQRSKETRANSNARWSGCGRAVSGVYGFL